MDKGVVLKDKIFCGSKSKQFAGMWSVYKLMVRCSYK